MAVDLSKSYTETKSYGTEIRATRLVWDYKNKAVHIGYETWDGESWTGKTCTIDIDELQTIAITLSGKKVLDQERNYDDVQVQALVNEKAIDTLLRALMAPDE